MTLVEKIKLFFSKLFKRTPAQASIPESNDISSAVDVDLDIPQDETSLETMEDKIDEYKMQNIVLEKLNYLEQYIKIFSLNFPNEYSKYLLLLQDKRQEYQSVLDEYRRGFLGELTFSIDPEQESRRLMEITSIEEEIKNFVEHTVNYTIYKEKFSKLCFKLSKFYNALLDTNQDTGVVLSQLSNAKTCMQNLLSEVKTLSFFTTDSRKKEQILNHIIYGEYIFLKSYLRCGSVQDIAQYKTNLSEFAKLFVDGEYDKLISKFFLDDLEQYQLHIQANLSKSGAFNSLLNYCKNLEAKLSDYKTVLYNYTFFQELIMFENTVDNISDNSNIAFELQLPKELISTTCAITSLSVKNTAVSVLNMIGNTKAVILSKVISNFTYEISWREFYFLCKIFELCYDVCFSTTNTIFSFVADKFNKFDQKYPEYSSSSLVAKKEKLLNYYGSKQKKYISLLNCKDMNLQALTSELTCLKLDFLVKESIVYLNYSYFNGFKNLEQNFGKYKLMEELL